jgi:hypothetical protein
MVVFSHIKICGLNPRSEAKLVLLEEQRSCKGWMEHKKGWELKDN